MSQKLSCVVSYTVAYSFARVLIPCDFVANATVDQKARLLEQKVAENMSTINQLRQERTMLLSDHKALQKRYSEATKVSKPRTEQMIWIFTTLHCRTLTS